MVADRGITGHPKQSLKGPLVEAQQLVLSTDRACVFADGNQNSQKGHA